ncbi:hypothetical protein FACS189459_7160 [Bacilli bacterium]|nr:hypothetical protein FACS189459_7160 [Bacilli bacterium]
MAILLISLVVVLFPNYRKRQKLTDKLNNSSREMISGVRVVRAFNAQGYETEKFNKVNKDVTKLNIFVNATAQGVFPAIAMLQGLIAPLMYLTAAMI